MSPKLENFREAFTPPTSGILHLCECEKVYFDSQDPGCFEPGELERLRSNPNAIELDKATGGVCFEGYDYCYDCTCWHERAMKIIAFLDNHAYGIAEYLSLERKRKFDEANASPVVTGEEQ